jgi:hypothetical protein
MRDEYLAGVLRWDRKSICCIFWRMGAKKIPLAFSTADLMFQPFEL